MDKLTLDTNVLRDWLWCEGKLDEDRHKNDPSRRKELGRLFQVLRALCNAGMCDLGITTQTYTDQSRTPGRLPEYLEGMIGRDIKWSGPSISTFPIMFPVVFVGQGEIEDLFRDVFPQSHPSHKNYANNMADAYQLYAHKIAKRDIFITQDRRIVRREAVLWEKWEIRVMSLQEYLARYPPHILDQILGKA